jgi:hypothetical protein
MAVDGARKHQIKARDTVTATVTLVPVLLTYLPISVLPTDIRATRLGNLAMTSMFRLSRRLFTSLRLAKRKDDWKKGRAGLGQGGGLLQRPEDAGRQQEDLRQGAGLRLAVRPLQGGRRLHRGTRGLQHRLSDLQSDNLAEVISSLHVHRTEDRITEVLLVPCPAPKLQQARSLPT